MQTHPVSASLRRANGRLAVDGRSARGRRLAELLADYGRNAEHLDGEEIRGAISSAAALKLQLEDIEAAIARGEPIEQLSFNRLVNTHRRSIAELARLKREARVAAAAAPPAPSSPSSPGSSDRDGPGTPRWLEAGRGGWSCSLWRHFHWRAWVEGMSDRPYAELQNDHVLIGEYAARETAGAFRVDAAIGLAEDRWSFGRTLTEPEAAG